MLLGHVTFFVWKTRACIKGSHWVTVIYIHITLSVELHRPFVHSPLYFPWCWSLLTTSCIYGSPSTLFLSGSQQSGRTSSQFSTCVTPYINTEPHVRRHSCRRPRPSSQHTLLHSVCECVLEHRECVYVCVCGVKGAIHEQLAGVKSGKGWTAVYDF